VDRCICYFIIFLQFVVFFLKCFAAQEIIIVSILNSGILQVITMPWTESWLSDVSTLPLW
jgi:hypothetical protein